MNGSSAIQQANGAGNGDVLWRLGYQGDFNISCGDDTDWFAAQHDVNIATPNGTGNFELALFDNGDGSRSAEPDPVRSGSAAAARLLQRRHSF